MSSITNAVLKAEADNRALNADDLTRLLGLSRKVAEIESNNIVDRYQGDNPELAGRGKYQFENDKGSNSSKTAANRLKAWEKNNKKLPIPKKDREELSKDSPDFAKLSEDTQDALFFINLSIHPDTDFTAIAKGNQDPKDVWLNYHWAGDEKDRESKAAMWDSRFSDNMLAKAAATAKTFMSAL